MRRRDVPKALLSSAAAGSLPMADKVEARTCSAPCYGFTQAEINARVTSSNANQAYLPGDVRRYGADPTGSADSTAALNRAIATGHSLYFCDGTFLTAGNHSPLSHTTWWGTGTLKGNGTTDTLVTIDAITGFTFSINTDASLQKSPIKIALSANGTSDFAIRDGRHTQGAILIGLKSGCSNFSIDGNSLLSTILDNVTNWAAIVLNATCTKFEVTNNRISNPTGAGIAIFNGANQGVVANNICTSCVGSGIYVNSANYVTIHGNICKGNAQSGIGLNASNPKSYGYPAYCSVTANICANNTYDGIDYNLAVDGKQHPTWTTISGNILSGNGSPRTGGTGIYLANVDEAIICGNTMVGNNLQGLFLNSCNYCTLSGNSVVANGANAANTLDGIYIHGNFNSVTGNTSTNNGGTPTQRYGISESPSSNYNCITGNNFNNNVTGALKIIGGNTIVQGNAAVVRP